ncbi:STAS domain-containing protein [Desulfogranum mediterraneum]|uniref:STAS domain-containing protein n=1 Tax=Desulfogranum mediterraneum TaxID=160661 RepID=UPI000409B0F2|nr:STAS domain-containing protein [Desulfogranum mediterraneum]
MKIIERDSNDYLTIQICGRLDSGTAGELEAWTGTFIPNPAHPLVIDFAELDYISSAGLRVMFNFARELKGSGVRFAVCRCQDHVREIFEISGFDTFIPLYASPEAFVAQ